MTRDVRSRLAECFRLVFPTLDVQSLGPTPLAELPGWDSVEAVTLVSVVEEEFGRALDPELVDEDVSFDAICAHLEAGQA